MSDGANTTPAKAAAKERMSPAPMSSARAVVTELRPRQWTKNLIVFAALVFSGNIGDPRRFGLASAAFGAFCLLSGAVYLLNDVADVARDRLHPVKRLRPVAAGVLGVGPAAAMAVVIAAAGLIAAAFIGRDVLLVAACFLVLQLAYTFALKRLVILDAMAIAGGFVLRVVAGAVAIDVVASPWIILCTGLLAMFLALIKRRSELTGDDDLTTHRPALAHYTEPFLDSMIATITSATIVAYSLYTFLAHERHEPSWMMVTIPFVAYGLFRYLYLVHLKGLGGSPEEILVSDVPMIVDIVLFVAVSIVVLRLV